MEVYSDSSGKPSTGKKRIKRILFVLGIVVGAGIMAFLILYILFKIKIISNLPGISIMSFYILFFLVSLYIEILVFYLIIWGKSKNESRKYLRNLLITTFLFFIVIRLVLTKRSMIPDYFEINCLGKEKFINDGCIDCKCEIIRIGPMMPHVPINHDGKVCCEGTYKYKVNRYLN